MADLGSGLIDADNHYYEPPDCFTRYLAQSDADVAIRMVERDGQDQLMVGDRPFTFLIDPFRDTVAKPGSLREMLRSMKSGSFRENEVTEQIQPEYVDRAARLERMDQQGLEAVFLFPTLGVCIEHFMRTDVEATYANLRAFNRWVDDDWGLNHEDRIYAAAMLSLLDADRAVAELEFVLDRGARIIHLRPGPQGGRSPADPIFDPFWARVEEAGAVVAFHISESGYNELFSVGYGEEANPTSHQQSALQWTCFYGDRPIMDTIAALIYHNLFGRFPGLRIMSVENGSLWVPYLMAAMDKMKGMGRNGPWPGGYVRGRSSDIFREHVYVSPYHEEDIVALAELTGADRVLFGSDWPHAEGLADPSAFAEGLKGLPESEIRLIMSDNGRRLVPLR